VEFIKNFQMYFKEENVFFLRFSGKSSFGDFLDGTFSLRKIRVAVR